MPSSFDQPGVSVIIPTYNRSSLLRHTIESVLSQTYPSVEIIVVDDASTDDTPAVVKSYGDRVIYIREPVNNGGDTVCFSGLKVASGKYINFLDHDDLFLPEKLERQVQMLEERPDLGLAHCGYFHIDKEGNLLEKISFLPEGDVLKQLLLGDFVWSGGPLYRRSSMENAGMVDEFWSAGDWSRVLRMAQAGYPFGCVQEPLGAYRILTDSEVSNVAGLEEWVLQTLDRVFASPDLPADVTELKEEAYARLHLYLCCRYYSSSQWKNASKNLDKALNYLPDWKDRPEVLSRFFFEDALNVRVSEPVNYIDAVLAHLPESASALVSYRDYILARVHFGLSMRSFARDHESESKNFLILAIKQDPNILNGPEDFIEILCRFAMSLPEMDPVTYIKNYFDCLPPQAVAFSKAYRKVMGQVRVLSAFQSYYAGHYHNVPGGVLRAWLNAPALMKNRGVASIFFKSMMRLVNNPKGYANTSYNLDNEIL